MIKSQALNEPIIASNLLSFCTFRPVLLIALTKAYPRGTPPITLAGLGTLTRSICGVVVSRRLASRVQRVLGLLLPEHRILEYQIWNIIIAQPEDEQKQYTATNKLFENLVTQSLPS